MVLFIKRILESGISPQTEPELVKRIKLNNDITLTVVFFIVPYVFIFYSLGYPVQGLLLIPAGLLCFLVFYFNKIGWLLASRLWLIVLLNIVLGIYAVMFGRESGIHLLYFVFVGIPFLIFGLTDIAQLSFSVILPTILFYIIQFGSVGSSTIASPEDLQIIYSCMISLVILWTIINHIYFSAASKEKEDQLERTERKFRNLMDRAPDALVICSSDSTIQLVNNRFHVFFGFFPSDVVGKKFSMLLSNESTYQTNPWAAYFDTTISPQTVERTLKRKDGSTFPAELSTAGLETDNGLMIATSIRDITDRKQLEALKILSAQSEARNKELEQFTFIVSHDLKTPVNNTLQLIELLKIDLESGEKGEETIAMITRSITRMERLIKNLLTFSVTGKHEEFAEVDCSDIMDEIKQDMRTLISNSHTQLILGSLPKMKAQPTSIRLLFQNLIGNAIKYHRKDNPPIIQVESFNENGFWKFAIRDNGIGISKENYKKIFEAFQRLHEPGEFDGTGLGLAHCKKIINQHGGTIWVESGKENGSTFYFTIPKR